MRYLKSEQVGDTLNDSVFSATYFLHENVIEKIANIRDDLGGYFEKDKKAVKDKLIRKIIRELAVLEKDVEELDISEDKIYDAVEHVAICNEIYDSLEMNRLMKKHS